MSLNAYFNVFVGLHKEFFFFLVEHDFRLLASQIYIKNVKTY